MGRHHKQREAHAGRVAVTVAAVGFGALQLGGIASAAAPPAPVRQATPPAPAPAKKVAGTSCTDARIKACVDLSANRTWLLDGKGHVVYGPVPNSHGAKGHETPTGEFVVQWKDKDHRSGEFNHAPMPYSVFFDTHGRSFHGGSLTRDSSGCVHLRTADAKRFFDFLQPNDRVQIVP